MWYLRRFVLAVCVLSAMTFFVDSTSAAAFKHVAVGDEVAAFSLPDTAGGKVDFGELHGDGPLTIVVFWALWSPKSATQLDDVQKLLDEFGAKGLKAVAINAEGASAPADLDAKVAAFAQERGLKFPMALDKGLEQYNTWGVIALPSTAFLDKSRKIVFEFSGHPSSAYEDMRAQVLEGLGLADEVAASHKPKHERYRPTDRKVTLNFGLAKTQFDRNQFSKSKEKLDQVLADDPQYPDAHALNGALHLGIERDGKAEAGQTAREAFQKAVDLDATLPLGLAGLAHFALRDGDLPKALELTRAAVEHTEDQELPELPAGGAASGDEGGRGARVAAQLERAAAAQEAGDAQQAKALVAEVVDGLIALPSGQGGRARKMLEGMKKQ
ncbi:MAG: redoxin domain-containing protein [Thermodesulfobacteriota bacterium]